MVALGTVNIDEALASSKAQHLDLSHRKLPHLPEDCQKLRRSNMTSVDMTGNQIKSISDAAFPPGLQILRMTGNEVAEMPSDVTSYASLEQIYAGSNRFTSAEWLFNSPTLLHAGLSYNQIPSLPKPASFDASGLALRSLDLGHNNLCSLKDTLDTLAALPKLRILSLLGNPLALLQNYRTSVLAALPALESFDGKSIPQDKSKYDGERPPTRATESGGQPAEEHTLEEPIIVDIKISIDKITPVLVEGDLPPEPDEEEIARREKAKKDKGKKGVVEEEPELPKVTFHIEYSLVGHMAFVTDTFFAGEPPEEEEEVVVEKPKKDPKKENPKDKKAKGKKEKEPPPPPPEDAVPKKWPDVKFAALPRTTVSRDMFRDGIQFTLVKIIPPPLPPPPEEPEEEKKPAKKGKGTTPPAPVPEPDPDAPPPPPPPEPTRIVMGTAQWKPTALLDGETIKAQTVVSFKPPPELFNAKGIMTPLKGQDMESTGTARITFALHIPEPPKKEEPEAEAPEKVPEKEKPDSRGKGSAKSKK